jgi:hypothetical protein
MKRSALFFCIVIFSSCNTDNVNNRLPAYDGIVSFNTNLSSNEPYGNYTVEFQTVYNMGARGAQLAAPWKSLNPTGSTYDMATVNNPYFGLATLRTMGYEAIFLNIAIITVGTRSMPADISDLSFDDPVVKARFKGLIDAVLEHVNDKVLYISLGNEVDIYFSSHASEWVAYISLVQDARNYIKSKKPGIMVGVTTTFEGATVTAGSEISLLNSKMDALMLTYYPVNSNYVVRDPSTVEADAHKLIVLAGSKPLIMQEWGYPSSTALGSSEQKQADFFQQSFTILKEHGADHFPFVSFFKYRDWNAAHCQALTGQTSGQSFYEFTSSLGLKKNDGTPKEAYEIISAELH